MCRVVAQIAQMRRLDCEPTDLVVGTRTDQRRQERRRALGERRGSSAL